MSEPFLADPDFTLYVGDALEALREMQDDSIHCVVTSPPYWGLRDYGTGEWEGGDRDCDHLEHVGGPQTDRPTFRATARAERRQKQFGSVCQKCGAIRVDRQLGIEATPAEYVARMVEVFREVRRVLRADGTCWLNLGDSYANDTKWGGTTGGKHVAGLHAASGGLGRGRRESGLKEKELVGIPWRVALALQEDGWWLRSDVIWAKPNPMTESVTDRPTVAHEYVFLLTKAARYFYDADAISEPIGVRRPPQEETLDGSAGETPRGPDGRRRTHVEARDGSAQHRDGERWPSDRRNKRSVWTIATGGYKDAHFATFPEELVELCIGAGTSGYGCCSECGAPWQRTEDDSPVESDWRPTCTCAGVDYSLIRTPTGEGGEPDPSLEVGRAGRDRPRNDGEGTRPITRYEQARYAEQLKSSPARPAMAADAGVDAFAHYIRTDKSGARPVPGDLLEKWVANGWLERVAIPDLEPLVVEPCTVLDPFMGSGTTALVARKMARRCVGIELNPEYAELIAKRTHQLSLFA